MSPLKAILSKKSLIYFILSIINSFSEKKYVQHFYNKKKLPWMIFQLKLKQRRLVDNISRFSQVEK